jgi:hypothetical protein
LGGYIQVVSKVNEGSTFTFGIKANTTMRELNGQDTEDKLMMVSNTPFQVQHRITETFVSNKLQASTRKSKTCTCNDILIVDDNEYNFFVLSNYLKSINLKADEVSRK